MRSMEPPKVARWMLSHFGCSPNNATVIGDLDERYRIGHSPAWYWRQVATAIVVGFFKEIWSHKLRALIAVLTGWIVLLAAFVRTTNYPWAYLSFSSVTGSIAVCAISAWLVARISGSHFSKSPVRPVLSSTGRSMAP